MLRTKRIPKRLVEVDGTGFCLLVQDRSELEFLVTEPEFISALGPGIKEKVNGITGIIETEREQVLALF